MVMDRLDELLKQRERERESKTGAVGYVRIR